MMTGNVWSGTRRIPSRAVTWSSQGRRFVIPDDTSCDEYPVFQQLAFEIHQRFGEIGESIEANCIAFTEKHIYIGSRYGIFRYGRSTKTMSLIVPDYGMVGSEITSIQVSEDESVFDIEFRRPGSDLVESMKDGSGTRPR